jgi:hypothetical protein
MLLRIVFYGFFIHLQSNDFHQIPPSAIKEIGREIGRGAFGRVYVARISDIPGKDSSQIVAIKKLKSEYPLRINLKFTQL